MSREATACFEKSTSLPTPSSPPTLAKGTSGCREFHTEFNSPGCGSRSCWQGVQVKSRTAFCPQDRPLLCGATPHFGKPCPHKNQSLRPEPSTEGLSSGNRTTCTPPTCLQTLFAHLGRGEKSQTTPSTQPVLGFGTSWELNLL